MIARKCENHFNGFQPYNRSKNFIKINPFFLIILFGNKLRSVHYNFALFIQLVLEYLLGANDWMAFGGWHKSPRSVPYELIQLFLHDYYPTLLFSACLNFYFYSAVNKKA